MAMHQIDFKLSELNAACDSTLAVPSRISLQTWFCWRVLGSRGKRLFVIFIFVSVMLY